MKYEPNSLHSSQEAVELDAGAHEAIITGRGLSSLEDAKVPVRCAVSGCFDQPRCSAVFLLRQRLIVCVRFKQCPGAVIVRTFEPPVAQTAVAIAVPVAQAVVVWRQVPSFAEINPTA